MYVTSRLTNAFLTLVVKQRVNAFFQLGQLALSFLRVVSVLRVAMCDARLQSSHFISLLLQTRAQRPVLVRHLTLSFLLLREIAFVLVENRLEALLCRLQVVKVDFHSVFAILKLFLQSGARALSVEQLKRAVDKTRDVKRVTSGWVY